MSSSTDPFAKCHRYHSFYSRLLTSIASPTPRPSLLAPRSSPLVPYPLSLTPHLAPRPRPSPSPLAQAWIAAELAPCVSRRLGSPAQIALPIALLATLPATLLTAVDAIGGCSSHIASSMGSPDLAPTLSARAAAETTSAAAIAPAATFAIGEPPGCSAALRAAAIALALLSSPVALGLAVGTIGGGRRLLQRACSCFGGATAAPNRTLEILVALAASLLAYGLASAIAIGVPTALLVATCTDVKGESVVRLGASVATLVALLSVLFARTHPRGVLVLAIIALAIMGAVGLERGRLQRS